jgi:hypothetical protein
MPEHDSERENQRLAELYVDMAGGELQWLRPGRIPSHLSGREPPTLYPGFSTERSCKEAAVGLCNLAVTDSSCTIHGALMHRRGDLGRVGAIANLIGESGETAKQPLPDCLARHSDNQVPHFFRMPQSPLGGPILSPPLGKGGNLRLEAELTFALRCPAH